MQQRLLLVAAAAVLASTAASQAPPNAVTGLDGNLYDISSPRYWGRRGAAHPGGEIGFTSQNDMCNPGTVNIPWFAVPATNHPKFGFMVARLQGDRMVQISDRTFCKHAFLSLNDNAGPCIPCTNLNAGSQMFVGCSDIYSNSHNSNRGDLGPADEIDPWLGTWTMVGSYFDRGFPPVAPPASTDGVSSPITPTDSVMNRVTIKEADLLVAGSTFFNQIHLLHEGEPVANRDNNIRTRGVSFTWTGTTWTTASVGISAAGSVLNRWTGATVNLGGNGSDDGRMAVAVKVTGPTNGLWHYEYAVHNIDNSRGGATLRIPLCPSARVLNPGFKDIDANALNQWTGARLGNEYVFSAPGDNPLNWNCIYNFWFDSDAGPEAGNVQFDQARLGAGALTFGVPSSVPNFVPNVYLGDGCGAPAVTVSANGIATIPNPAFAINLNSAPFTAMFLFMSPTAVSSALGGGCTLYLDGPSMQSMGFVFSDATGLATFGLPVPLGLPPGTASLQAASIALGTGAFLGDFNLSNGLTLRVGLTGCP